ncbi:hypothetical protein LTR97_000396 [Elasticomyces elasticus]|uniref:DUF1740-domain-containing protein n=1 Tax=Elasticomyces elasticus TaxID=574655 RepID=A0AAN7VXC4_9PEZI|nr:hypothetical protein LTR97_000396 [Elasticomyces elasticus]
MSQSGEPIVPKFGSFKPKKVVSKHEEPARAATSRDDLSASRDEHGRRTDRHSHSRRNGDRYDRHRREHTKPRPVDHHNRRSPVQPLTLDEFEQSDAFIVDRRGDSKNVEYGTLYRYSVPSFNRTGYGRVLGASSHTKIDRAESSDTYVILSTATHDGRNRQSRLLGSTRSRTGDEHRLRIIKPVAGNVELENAADYLPLRDLRSRKRKRDGDGDTDSMPGRQDVDYRSVEGKAAPNMSPSDDDLESGTDSGDGSIDMIAQEIRKANAALVRATKERPTDVDAWISLVNFQAKIINPSADPANSIGSSERRGLADIRLSIYDQALRHVTKDKTGYAQLVLGMLEQGGILWDTSRLTTKWNEILNECSDNVLLWTRYLDFIQTGHLGFRYELCKEAYLRCLTILHGARESVAESEKVAHVQVYVLLRFTSFLRDAGYDEFAHALWQVMLEYHFLAPARDLPTQDPLKAFEDYWDSELPRIGEADSQGWAHYAQNGGKAARNVASPTRPTLDIDQPFQSFAIGERSLLGKLILPVTDDKDNLAADDPFRYVIFSEIRPFLETLVTGLPKENLLGALLTFMRLPPKARPDDAAPDRRSDQFIAGDDTMILSNGNADPSLEHYPTTTFNLFRNAFSRPKSICPEPELLDFIDRVLSQLALAQPNDEALAEYHVAFKLAFFQDKAVKAAKQLLKSRPSSLRLYNAYALTEARLGRIERAAEVWTTALKMSKGFADHEQVEVVLLWHSWTLTLLYQEGERSDVLRCLIAMCDANPSYVAASRNTGISSSERLRAAQVCEAGFERMVYSRRADLAVLYAECHLWFAYLADEEALGSAIEVQSHHLSAAKEMLLQAQAGLFKLHIDRHRPYKPAALRAELLENLRTFPNNTVLLELYVQIGAQTRIDDRLRASLQEDVMTGPNATVVGWSCVIAQELNRFSSFETSGATANSVRSLFARALLAPESKVRHSVMLWKWWLAFELSGRHSKLLPIPTKKQDTLEKLKQIFLDGLRLLPWSKEWVVLGLQAMAEDATMTNGELRQVYDVLGERELRVRMSVEDMEEAMSELVP